MEAEYKSMKQSYCEKEKEIIQAFRGGTLSAELERHASSCAICSDTVAVSKFLQSDVAATPIILPDSDFIWWMGQLASKQMAVERATLSIALVKKTSYIAISTATLWLILAPGHLRSIASALSKYEMWSGAGSRESVLLMATGALFFTLLSSLYFARSEK
jgi:hypothetical protein